MVDHRSKLAVFSIGLAVYVWIPVSIVGISYGVAFLKFGDPVYQYLAFWSLVPFVPSFVAWYRHVWKPWTSDSGLRNQSKFERQSY